ncbi:MAG: hypothetical protein ACTHMC_02510 [Pseudobacter sp.]|uniref:hypothetical protein n=1 Tax=Pseudobacter sp. TaxID=2045420 RepID=UPI003F7CFE25
MNKFLLAFFLISGCMQTAVAQKEVYDIVSYISPSGWKKDSTISALAFSRIDGGSWGQLAIYKSTASKGSIEEDVQSEWEKIVTAEHTITGNEETTTPETADGWTVVSRSGIWQFNGANVATILTTYSNNQVCVSILCNATAKPYLEDFKKLTGSIELPTQTATNSAPVQAEALQNNLSETPAAGSITGEWRINIFETMGAQLTAGYFRKEYTFRPDGTYQFLQKDWSAYVKNILFSYETGTYTVNGKTLVITPLNGYTQEWSKNPSNRNEEWGSLLKTTKRKLDKSVYTFNSNYYSGSDNSVLELFTEKSTTRESIPSGQPLPYKTEYYLNTKPGVLIVVPPGFKP